MKESTYVPIEKIKDGWWVCLGEDEDVPELQVRVFLSFRSGAREFIFMDGSRSGVVPAGSELRARQGRFAR